MQQHEIRPGPGPLVIVDFQPVRQGDVFLEEVTRMFGHRYLPSTSILGFSEGFAQHPDGQPERDEQHRH